MAASASSQAETSLAASAAASSWADLYVHSKFVMGTTTSDVHGNTVRQIRADGRYRLRRHVIAQDDVLELLKKYGQQVP
ncbi:MAG: hypothetical protein ACREPY_12800 [Rhodanobacteraceae bacterium]